MLEMRTFYKTRYTSQMLIRHSKIHEDQRETCEGLITAEECLSALKMLAKNKTPGSDGLTAEFYLCFWEYVATPLINCFNYAFQCGEMSISQRRGITSLTPKKNKDTLLLKNCGPVSVLYTDYKIVMKMYDSTFRKS